MKNHHSSSKNKRWGLRALQVALWIGVTSITAIMPACVASNSLLEDVFASQVHSGSQPPLGEVTSRLPESDQPGAEVSPKSGGNVETSNEPESKAAPPELPRDPLEVLLSFYQTLIVVLLTLLGVVVGLAFVSLRLISRNIVEDVAEESAIKALENSRGFYQELENLVSERVFEGFDQIGSSLEKIDKLEIQITEMLEQQAEEANNDEVVQP